MALGMLPFEFAVYRTPLSQGSNNAKEGGWWQKRVRSAAASDFASRKPIAGDLAFSITWLCERFQPSGQQPDVDNIAKPIVDALKGLVYADDASITDVLCRRRSSGSISGNESLSTVLSDCLSQFGDSVYIVIDEAPIREVHFQWKI